ETVRIADGRGGHHHRGHEGAQRVVVHHVVDVVLPGLDFHLLHGVGNVFAHRAQAHVLARELHAVHAAVPVGRLAVALPPGQFNQRVVVGRPAGRQVTAPALVLRVHGDAVAVLVVVRLRAG